MKKFEFKKRLRAVGDDAIGITLTFGAVLITGCLCVAVAATLLGAACWGVNQILDTVGRFF